MSAAGPSEAILRLVKEKGWNGLTELQLEAYRYISLGANLLITAPTGTGKTEAALLPVLDFMLAEGSRPLALLYVTPAKALIDDLYERISWWASRLGLRVARKHGDTSAKERAARARRAPHILITTPESLEIDLDWARKFRENYRRLKWVIVDEVHDLLASKRGAQLALLLERLRRYAGRDLQVIGLSATMGDPETALAVLSGSSARPRRVLRWGSKRYEFTIISAGGEGPEAIAEKLAEIVEEPTLVFVNSRFMAEKLKAELEKRLPHAEIYVHHSSVSQEMRKRAEEALKAGRGVVICTKTLELGIDIGEVRKVVIAGSPGSPDALMQRTGRSGHRLEATPQGLIVASGLSDVAEALAEASLAARGVFTLKPLKRAPLDVVAREVIGILLEKRGATPWEIYEELSGSPIFSLTLQEVNKLLSYMEETGYVRRRNGKYVVGPLFYKIWSFNGRQQGGKRGRSFPEFFTTINTPESFKVESGGREIGSIDSLFVWRYLRPGDVIRLSGHTWRVKSIDEAAMKIEMEPYESEAEVPLWRGTSIRRPREVAREAMRLLAGGSLPGHVKLVGGALSLEGAPVPGDGLAIHDRAEREDVILYPLGDGGAEALAVVASFMAQREEGLTVYYRFSYYGFSVATSMPGRIVKLLNSIDPKGFEALLERALRSSPLVVQALREIQYPLGRLGSIDPFQVPEGDLLVREAITQVIELHLDVEAAIDFLRGLRSGSIKLEAWRGSGYHPLTRELVKAPPVRPWMPGLARRIASLIEGYALTVEEIADALGISEKTVEAKLKDMRRSDYGPLRTVSFVDVDDGETRWTLASSLPLVAELDEFASSFRPRMLDATYRVVLKRSRGDTGIEVLLTPRIIIEEWDSIKASLPPEAHQVIVANVDFPDKDLTLTYYNVPLEALRYLILNAATVIERRLESLLY